MTFTSRYRTADIEARMLIVMLWRIMELMGERIHQES
jgi:hypothetical protein